MLELIALLQSRPEPEAQEIYRQIRMNTYSGDINAFVRQIHEGVLGGAAMVPRRLSLPHQQQLPSQSTFPPYGAAPQPPGSATQLPPIRSVVDLPPPGSSAVPLPPVMPQRNSSLTSGMSECSYSSKSSSEHARSSISPRDLQHGWT